MRKNFKKNRKWGFSFLEVMLVVFILSISLVVFVQVISKSISHSTASRDTIIASHLAQEGAELVKNVRDNNWAQKKPAFENMDAVGNYIVNYSDNVGSISQGGPVALKINNEGYYASSGTTSTKFLRKIYIENDGANKKVTSTVVWERSDFPSSCNASSKCVYAEIILTKWGS